MFGVLVNGVGILIGTSVGITFKRFLTPAIANAIQLGLGYCTLILGIKMGLEFRNVLVLVGSVSLGGVIGVALKLEERVESVGKFLRKNSNSSDGGFVTGFTTASILFCTGAMGIIGAINSGVNGNNELLFVKTALDGAISVSFAVVYGIGVAFSALPVLLYQGSIALLASKLEFLTHPNVLNDLTAVGGVLIAMIGINLIGLKKAPVGDFLPAVAIVIALKLLGF